MSNERIAVAIMRLIPEYARCVPGLSHEDPREVSEEYFQWVASRFDLDNPWDEELYDHAHHVALKTIMDAGDAIGIMSMPGTSSERLTRLTHKAIDLAMTWCKENGLDADRAFEVAFC